MAHSCPDCGALCYCGGDIDDIDFGDDGPDAMACTHYLRPECCNGDEDLMDDDHHSPSNATLDVSHAGRKP